MDPYEIEWWKIKEAIAERIISPKRKVPSWYDSSGNGYFNHDPKLLYRNIILMLLTRLLEILKNKLNNSIIWFR